LRLVLALAGFATALLAIAFEDRRLGWAAIVLLIGALLARLLHRRRQSSDRSQRD
jgi:apolipoprotein N-acyltransferase